jgi:chromosome segregation ATPase
MEIKIDKAFFIKIGIVALLCFACYCSGRFTRVNRITENSFGTEQQIEQLRGEVTELNKQLEDRIAECNKLSEQISNIELGVDGAIGTIGSIRNELQTGSNEIGDGFEIIKEHRRRIEAYENRFNELETNLTELKNSFAK